VDCYSVFSHGFSILFFNDFFQNCICRFYFFWYRADWEFILVIFFFKTLWIATMFLQMIFFVFLMIFFQNYLCRFYFLILSWLRIIVAICGENTVTFLVNYYGLLQCFFHGFFFLKLSLLIFFNIELVENYNYK
jgi:hypothetical protein